VSRRYLNYFLLCDYVFQRRFGDPKINFRLFSFFPLRLNNKWFTVGIFSK
jgi:hypothetical protein